MNNNECRQCKVVTMDSTYFQQSLTEKQLQWNFRKICHLRRYSAGPTILDLTQLPEVSPQLVLDLFSKVNPEKDKELYFRLPPHLKDNDQLHQLPSSPNLEAQFSHLSLNVPQQKPCSNRWPLPVLAKIFSFLPANEVIRAQRTAVVCTQERFLQTALQGKEDEVAKASFRSMLQTGTTTIPTSLEPIRLRVKKLDLSSFAITPESLKSITRYFPNLEELNLSYTNLTNPECIQALQNFLHLQTLDITSCNTTDEALKHLSQCKTLRTLTVNNTNITGACCQLLPSSLVEFNCRYCKKLAEEAILGLQDKERLEMLVLQYTPIQGTHFDKLAPSLKVLDCEGCKNLTDEAILGLQDKVRLETLVLEETPIRGTHFAKLAPSLKVLDCEGCKNLTDEAILGLQDKVRLERLVLACTSIQGTHFAKLAPSLKELNCYGCNKLSNAAKIIVSRIQAKT